MYNSEPSVGKLQEQINNLETIIKDLQNNKIILYGINNLKQGGTSWRDKVYTMIYHSNIPFFWIVNMDQDIDEPTKVIIYCINSFVRNVTFIRLNNYINMVSGNISL